jgi:hypothetical protein
MADQPKWMCLQCSRMISPDDSIIFGHGHLSHLSCQRPRTLSAEERTLLFVYCRDHWLAKCGLRWKFPLARPCLRPYRNPAQRARAPVPRVSQGPDRQRPRASLRLRDAPNGSPTPCAGDARGSATSGEAKPPTGRCCGCADARGQSCTRRAQEGHAESPNRSE